MVRRQRHLGMGLGFLQWADGLRLGHFHGKVEGDPDGTSLEDIWITSVFKLFHLSPFLLPQLPGVSGFILVTHL